MMGFCQMASQLGKSRPQLMEGGFGHTGGCRMSAQTSAVMWRAFCLVPQGHSQWRAVGRLQTQDGVFSAHPALSMSSAGSQQIHPVSDGA